MAVKSTGLSTKGLRSEFFATFDQVNKANNWWEDLVTRVPSISDIETYRFLGSVPPLREWGTGRMAKGLGVEGYSVANAKYEATLEVDRDEIADDQTGQILIRLRELAQRAAVAKNKQLATLITSGASTGFNSYDGVTFFNSAHVSGSSGSQSNVLTFDVSAKMPNSPDTPDTPDPQTLRTAFDECVSKMMLYKDDVGEIEDHGLDGLAVLCHPNVWRTWEIAINAGLLGARGGVGGDSNVQTVIPRIVPVNHFTNISMFYVMRTGGTIRPFIFQDREPMTFDSLAEGSGSSEEFMREKYYYGVRGRYKLAYGMWKHAVSMDLE